MKATWSFDSIAGAHDACRAITAGEPGGSPGITNVDVKIEIAGEITAGGIEWIATGKTGIQLSIGEPVAEYADGDDRRIWCDTSGNVTDGSEIPGLPDLRRRGR